MSALTNALQDHIVGFLNLYEPNRKAVEDAALNLLNLNAKPYATLNNALARVDTVHDLIDTQLTAGKLHSWVSPRLAAFAFEGVFEASVAAWLAAGPPSNPPNLEPSVARLVDYQVRAFAAALGDKS